MKARRTVREPVQKRGREKKARIVDAARNLFVQQGYEAANTNRIAAEAGVSIGTLYAYFQNKRDIFLEVIREFVESRFAESRQYVAEAFWAEADLEEVLYSLLKRHKENEERDKALHREFRIQAYKDEEVYRLYYSADERIHSFAMEILERYADQTDLEDLEAAAFVLRYVWDDIIDHLVFERKNHIDDDRILRQLARMVYRYLTGGRPR